MVLQTVRRSRRPADRSPMPGRRAGARTPERTVAFMAHAGTATMSRMARAIALAMAFTSSAWAASAGGNTCEREMARAAERHGVPLGMLYAVGLAETGRGDSLQPYALNIEGRPSYDTDMQAARRQVEAARLAGARLI